jgi:hypothetical protein
VFTGMDRHYGSPPVLMLQKMVTATNADLFKTNPFQYGD